jgi:DNA repair protein RecO (recombination protein O)|tara:strand:- start:1241 stop:1921 length:681 start_codon:yes stop_codon:yes gene_type:complete
MIWDDIGFLLSKNRYNENSLISDIYTKNFGKVSGIIFGGTSKKIKNYLQIGNKLYVSYNSKNEKSMGYFKIEIQDALSPLYFDNNQKLSCISSAMNLVRLLTAESQKNIKIFTLLEEFYLLLNSENWIKSYIFWELELFKSLGYDLDFENLVDEKIIDNKKQYISKSSTEKRIIPNFLIEKNSSNEDMNSLLTGLKLLSDYLEKSILKPNNLNQPLSRMQFINSLK